MSVAIHHSITKTSQMLPQHHHVVPFRSWTKTKNRAVSCNNLNLTVSSCSKIPGAPTISQVLFSQNKPHLDSFITRTLSSIPQNSTQMMIATTTTPEIARLFHHFP
jgi:hypothetical protein